MEDFNDFFYKGQWDKALKLILNNIHLVPEIDSYDITWSLFYYALIKNGTEEEFPHFGKYSDLLKIQELCQSNGMKVETIPQAVAFRDKELIDDLLSKGHNIDEEDFGERSALIVASVFNDIDLVNFLIKRNANISHYDQEHLEAIDYTSSQSIIKLLKSNGGKTKQERDKEYYDYCEAQTTLNEIRKINLAFMRGAEEGNLIAMKEALQKSSMSFYTLNFAYPINGWTALHYAAKNSHKEIFKFLIEKGIDTYRENSEGLTAIEIAKRNGIIEI